MQYDRASIKNNPIVDNRSDIAIVNQLRTICFVCMLYLFLHTYFGDDL